VHGKLQVGISYFRTEEAWKENEQWYIEHGGKLGHRPADIPPSGLVFSLQSRAQMLLAPYVGQQLRVTGIDYNGIISVKKAEVRKNSKWEEIDIKSLIPGRGAKSS